LLNTKIKIHKYCIVVVVGGGGVCTVCVVPTVGCVWLVCVSACCGVCV